MIFTRTASGFAAALILAFSASAAEVSGELKKWHDVTLTIDGPQSSETAEPNPFTDYRLDVTFTHEGGASYTVPGYFAADGNAAITSAESGSKWRVHFAPDAVGAWNWEVSFRQGEHVALNDDPSAGEAWAPLHGQTGSLQIAPSDKSGRDFRAKGRLQYVGKHYLQFADSGEYFLKVGADAPENFLAYDDFDATPNKGDRRKSWAPHARDYTEEDADLLWGPEHDKGKNILGAINYLASEEMNVFSFLTFNVDGDDGNVFPHILTSDMETYEATKGKGEKAEAWDKHVAHLRFDVSKLAQWERIFSHADRKGMYLHFKMQETEVDHKMDGGDLGPERKAYCRELVARFAHHLALNWNLGEENTQTTEQVKAMAQYLRDVDPYDHHIVLHTYPNKHEEIYGPLLGDASALTGLSIQTSQPDYSEVHAAVKKWVLRSAEAGKPWVVACDEPGNATRGVVPDKDDPEHDDARKNALWGTFLAGGAGVEWYFGYAHDHSDLTLEDFRSRDLLWDQCRIALQVFRNYEIPFWTMSPMNHISPAGAWTLAGYDGSTGWAVVQARDGAAELDLPQGQYAYGWINPRTGEGLEGLLETGTAGGGRQSFSAPGDEDWILLLTTGSAPPQPKTAAEDEVVATEQDGTVTLEAEDFARQSKDSVRRWYVQTTDRAPGVAPDPDESHAGTANRGAYVEVLPDTRSTHGDKLVRGENFSNEPGQVAVLHYPVRFNTPGRYYVWVRAFSTGTEDNGIHVGLNGEWPEHGQRMQWCEGKNGWRWESRQRTAEEHCGVPHEIYLDVEQPGVHELMISMREDGFEMDQILLTRDRNMPHPDDAAGAQ